MKLRTTPEPRKKAEHKDQGRGGKEKHKLPQKKTQKKAFSIKNFFPRQKITF